MAEIPYGIVRHLAKLSDDDFIVWAEKIGYTISSNERTGDFRRRVVDGLERLTDQIQELETR